MIADPKEVHQKLLAGDFEPQTAHKFSSEYDLSGRNTLQIPADRHRCHYIKAKVRVHRYLDGRLAIFHGPRKLADYTADGQLTMSEIQAVA